MNNIVSLAATNLEPAAVLPRLLQAMVGRLRPSTRSIYGYAWRALAERVAVNGHGALLDYLCGLGRARCYALLLDWQGEMKATLQPNTINAYLAGVHWLIRVAYNAEVIDWTVTVPRLGVTKYSDTSGPTREEIVRMINATEGRDKAILLCFYTLGLRVSELVALNVEALNGNKLAVLGKGRDEEDLLTVPDSTLAAINTYLESRGEVAPSDPLFVTRTGRRMHRVQVYTQLRSLGERVGITKRVSPHRIRHTAVNEGLVETNGNIAKTAAMARHKDIKTTTIYWDRKQDAQGEVSKMLADTVDSTTHNR